LILNVKAITKSSEKFEKETNKYNELMVEEADEGYAVHLFAQSVDSVVCTLCKKVLKDVVYASCGDKFCRKCLQKLFKYEVEKIDSLNHEKNTDEQVHCPLCERSINSVVFTEDRLLNEGIQQMEVICPNSLKKHLATGRHTCSWLGQLCELDDHIKTKCHHNLKCCRSTACPLTGSFDRMTEYHRLTCEYRIVSCPYCNEDIQFNDFQKHCFFFCEMMLIKCKNNCPEFQNLMLPRKEMVQHEQNCLEGEVKCPLFAFGCNSTCKGLVKRSDFLNHTDNPANLKSAFENLKNKHYSVKTDVSWIFAEGDLRLLNYSKLMQAISNDNFGAPYELLLRNKWLKGHLYNQVELVDYLFENICRTVDPSVALAHIAHDFQYVLNSVNQKQEFQISSKHCLFNELEITFSLSYYERYSKFVSVVLTIENANSIEMDCDIALIDTIQHRKFNEKQVFTFTKYEKIKAYPHSNHIGYLFEIPTEEFFLHEETTTTASLFANLRIINKF
jgi:hypothetical protein